MPNPLAVCELEAECQPLFSKLAALQKEIRDKLRVRADNKNLKGDELVGWLGEIYGKLFYDGELVGDENQHDFVSDNCRFVSVKTRKGWKKGWKEAGTIPKKVGSDCPTHLLFVHLNDDYSLDRMWLFDWVQLANTGRFKEKMVRGSQRAFTFAIDEEADGPHVVYESVSKRRLPVQ
jgi:hypothetical protein